MERNYNLMYCIRARDYLNEAFETTICLYGNENQFVFMLDLCRWLSALAPKRLVELVHYAYGSKGTISEVRFDGQEIDIDDDGRYYKFEGDDYYVLKDSTEGLSWERMDE